jgi:DNA-binding MarR family transcriptional regulator
MSESAARSANLLGTVGLAVSDRIRAAGEEELGLGGSAPVALVALSTYLADQPLDEIARAFGITASAVVRLVDRLERDGLLARVACDDDARGAFATLTPAGRRKLDASRATHLDGVRSMFLDHFSDEELATLGRLWDRLDVDP